MLELSTFLATLERLWRRSGLLLWALATASLAAFAGFKVGTGVDPQRLGAAAQAPDVWPLPIGLALLILAGFRTYDERKRLSVRIVPFKPQFSWDVFKHPDGSMMVDIRGQFEVHNLADRPIILTDIKPVRPRIRGRFARRSVHVVHVPSGYSGRYAIPPRTKAYGSFRLFAYEDLSSRGQEMDVEVKVSDQFGRWHKIKVRRVRRG